MSGIPEGFSWRFLQAPVWTGILIILVYQTIPDADITCLDYSPNMMMQAREKAERLELKKITFKQGDVGALPLEDESLEIVFSLNDYHAFSSKDVS